MILGDTLLQMLFVVINPDKRRRISLKKIDIAAYHYTIGGDISLEKIDIAAYHYTIRGDIYVDHVPHWKRFRYNSHCH